MPVVIGEMTVEPAVEPERGASGTAPDRPPHAPLAQQKIDRIELALRMRAERHERLRAD
jgi:hypothetical protein